MKSIDTYNLHQPHLIGKEKNYLIKALKNNQLTQGEFIDKFKKKLSIFLKIKNVALIQNCTTALFMTLKLSNINKNDEVIVPTITYAATINAIRQTGANPIFFDCDSFFNIDIEKILEFLKLNTIKKKNFLYNRFSKKKISAIILVHVFGNLTPYNQELITICKKFNIKIIEDAAEALGSYWIKDKKKKHPGYYGNFACFSFNGNKIVTSAGGGAIVSNNSKSIKKIDFLINQAKKNDIEYIHTEMGFNFRLSNIHSAIGYAQMNNLKFFLKKKKIINGYYNEFLKDSKYSILSSPKYCSSNYWLNILDTSNNNLRKKLIKRLISKKVLARPVWKPNHLQAPFKKFQKFKIENAEKMYKSHICLPSGCNLSRQNIQYICNIINS